MGVCVLTDPVLSLLCSLLLNVSYAESLSAFHQAVEYYVPLRLTASELTEERLWVHVSLS